MEYIYLFILVIMLFSCCQVVSASDIPLNRMTFSDYSIAGFGDIIRAFAAQNVLLSERNELLKEQNKILFIQTCAPSPAGLTNAGKLCYDMGLYEKYNINISVTKNW